MVNGRESESKVLIPFLSANIIPHSISITAFENDVDADVSACKFTSRISCQWGSGSGGFPPLVISRRKYDSDNVEVVVALPSVVSEDMVTIDDFIEDISF